MPNIHLLDGKKISFSKSINGFDLTKRISKSLEKTALIMEVDGQSKALSHEIRKNSKVRIITSKAKEGLEVQSENQTLASITYQNYFKLYKKLCGCTGTAATESEEFFEIYNLNVVSIPTNKKMIRKDMNDQIFRTQKEKDDAIIKHIAEVNKKGQPILVFTSSINKSEHYSDLLKRIVEALITAGFADLFELSLVGCFKNVRIDFFIK